MFFVACEKGNELSNQAPDTQFSIEAINLVGENRLNSIVSLSWSGKDPDGYVKGFELSRDGIQWDFTTQQDSTFRFSLNLGSDTSDIELFVRAIDNEDIVDPTPDRINIPIRNTPPIAEFGDNLSIPDTAYLVTTTEWDAKDIDGDETITNVYISLNGATWYEINKTKKIFSIVPVDATATDTSNAFIYYGTDAIPASQQIEGLLLNDTNRIFIKAVDQAGTESIIDTSTTFFVKGKVNDLLVIGGISNPNPNQIYKDVLTNINANYDFIDMLVANGIYRPKIWNITFKLQLSFYDKLFFYSDETSLSNPYSGTSSLLLESAANSLQDYSNNGGKYFISTFFTHTTNIDGFIGVLPISGKSATRTSDNSVSKDSTFRSPIATFPDLKLDGFLWTAVGVFNIDSTDTEVLYTAPVFTGSFVNPEPWNDTKIIGSGRRRNGKLNQVFFNIGLWRLKETQADLDALFDQILNVEFN